LPLASLSLPRHPSSTLFPYTTLFRSVGKMHLGPDVADGVLYRCAAQYQSMFAFEDFNSLERLGRRVFDMLAFIQDDVVEKELRQHFRIAAYDPVGRYHQIKMRKAKRVF